MQGILGTSITHPIFYVEYCEDNTIDVFFGFRKLTTIPNNKNSIAFKSIISMLCNAGIRIKHIEENFNISFPTIKKIVDAFNESKDEEELLERLKNPGREPYKINKEISDYIYERSNYYTAMGLSYYHQKIIDDVFKKYNVGLSRETIRIELNAKESFNSTEDSPQRITYNDDISCDIEITKSNYSQCKILDSKKNIYRNCYAGILLLSSLLDLVFNDFPEIRTIDKQYTIKTIFTWWTFAVLLGAKNLEGQRYFKIEDFEYITGYIGLPSVEKMRLILGELSLLDNTNVSTFLLKKNIDYFIEEDTDYYLDGHFEEYTGEANILHGWSTVKNRVCKGNVDYFVHDGAGNPIFSLLLDNYNDFREIILKILARIKKLRPGKELTLIYDRGGFSTKLMRLISKDKDQHFITWQKGFKSKEAFTIEFTDHVEIEFPYNDIGKIRSYKVEFGEDNWECKDFTCRRIIIKRETKNNKEIYQSILTNDEETYGGVIIEKMLKRFKQENDFKKQKNHFGLDEITSYKKLEYGILNDKDTEKEAVNNDYKDKQTEVRNLQKSKKELLCKIGIEVFDETYLDTISIDFLQKNRKIIDEIKAVVNMVNEKKDELKGIAQKISKLQKCKNENKVELDLRPKRILGMIKLTSRNVLDKGAKEFLQIFGSLRDYQKVFRKLVQTGGKIEIVEDIMYVKLDSFGRAKFKEKCNRYFDDFNKKKIKTLDGKYTLNFRPF